MRLLTGMCRPYRLVMEIQMIDYIFCTPFVSMNRPYLYIFQEGELLDCNLGLFVNVLQENNEEPENVFKVIVPDHTQ